MPREFAWGGRANGILLPRSILPRRGPKGLRRDFETTTLRAERAEGAERAERAEGTQGSTDTYTSPGGIFRNAAGAGGKAFAGRAWAAQAVPPATRMTTCSASTEFVELIEPSYGKFEFGLRGLGGSGIARFCGAHSLGSPT
jgi:hypothetical protein